MVTSFNINTDLEYAYGELFTIAQPMMVQMSWVF